MLDLEINMALEAKKLAYAPYSNFYVGCVLKTKDGKYYTGCNVENDGIQSICAERVAITKAISEGSHDFDYMVVCGGKEDSPLNICLPCGYCRQFISEFVSADFKIYSFDNNKDIKCYKISDLLPEHFSL